MSNLIMGLFEITGTYHKMSEKEQKQITDKAKKQCRLNKNKKGDK